MLQVVGDRVIVRTEDQSVTERPSGVVMVEAYAPSVVGTVIACAEGHDLAPGDVVIFTPEAGQPVEWNAEPHLVLGVDEILAVYEGADV